MTVCGDGEYIIYTARAWRNKSFGSGVQFAWSSEGDDYAVRESLSKIKIFKKFKEVRARFCSPVWCAWLAARWSVGQRSAEYRRRLRRPVFALLLDGFLHAYRPCF